MSSRERLILLLLAAINFTHIMDFMVMAPLGTYLMTYFKISARQFSLLLAIYPVCAAISSFSAGFFVDRFDRKKVLLTAYSGFILGTLCCALSPTYHFLLISRAVAGLFGGLIGAQVMSIVADTFPYERRAAAMGAVMGAFSLASALGVPTGLYLATKFNWHAPFFTVAGMGALLIPLTILFLPPQFRHLVVQRQETASGGGERPSPLTIAADILRNPMQRMALALGGFLMMAHFLIIPFLNPFLEFNKGFQKKEVLLLYVVGGTLTFFTSPLLGKLADRIGKFRLFSIMAILSVAPILFIANLPDFPLWVMLSVAGFWFVVSGGRSIPAQAMISQVVPPARRGGFMSFNAALQQLFTGAASLIAGFLVTQNKETHEVYHYDRTGYLSIAVLAVAYVWAWRLNRAAPDNTQKSA